MHKSNFIIFLAEIAGTFGLLVAATGSIVYDGFLGKSLGIVFIAVIHFIGIGLMIFLFGRYSMAHFNPAVTVAYLVAGYIKPKQVLVYFAAQAIGAVLGTIFVKFVIGDYANLGLNYPNYEFSIPVIVGVEILASFFLMGSILLAVNIKRQSAVLVSVIISGTIALDVFFFGGISGASMNPIRSTTPALFTGILDDLWLYWTAPFVGSVIVALVFNKIKKRVTLS